MDPQMRLQLEVAYEALENGLHTIAMADAANTFLRRHHS